METKPPLTKQQERTIKEKKRRHEVDYLRSKIPYRCQVLFAHQSYAPNNDKTKLYEVVLQNVDWMSYEFVFPDTGVVVVCPWEAVKKILPQGVERTANEID